MAVDGGQQTRLVGHPSGNFQPLWSPDGRGIAFVSNRHGLPQIYLVDADGTGERRLTQSAATDLLAGWCPDGTRILFTRRRGESTAAPQEIWVVDIDGGSEAMLTGDPAGDSEPAWSPDGGKIAFVSERDGRPEVYLMNADGTRQLRLTRSGDSHSPQWSPDGRRIAFGRAGAGIWIMQADGSHQQPIRGTEPDDMFPVWSPDGTRIALSGHGETVGASHGWSDVLREADIYIVNVDGGGRTRLTANADWDGQPTWSPDGTWIAFTSDREGPRRIYLTRPDGSEEMRVAMDAKAEDQDPSWRPLASRPVPADAKSE